jgi:hypothetical protein
MSHDVQFWPRRGGPDFDLDRTRSWLNAQPNWTVSGPSATYQNADTGVYLTLDLNEPSTQEEPPLMATINVYRPSFFGLEAASVLGEFSSEFDLLVDDLLDGRGAPVQYTQEWLVSRWNESNAAGYAAIASRDSSPNALPRSRLVSSWQWNRDRAALQDQFADELFVPKIMAISTPGGPSTAVVWTDAMPFTLPPVQYVIVYRDGLAPHNSARKSSEMQLQSRDAVVRALGSYAQPRGDRIDFLEADPPPSVTEWIARLRSRTRGFDGLDWDRVHDAELLIR